METRTNLYPVYVSGQYLTSEHLNETHNFLWEEEKATRYLLIGNGIAHGMVADFTGTSLLESVSITSGVASTNDGYIIDIIKNTDFNNTIDATLVTYTLSDGSQFMLDKVDYDAQAENLNAASSKTLNGFELFPSDTAAENLHDGNKKLNTLSITLTSATNDFVVAAFVQITDMANNHCQQGDCNTKGVQRNFTIRYFLLKNDFLSQQNFAAPEYPLCSVMRIKNLAASTSLALLNQKANDAWTQSFKELSGYFTSGSGFELKDISKLLDANSAAALDSSIVKLNTIKASVSSASCPQYYNAFASDLSVAINELINAYNVHARNYPTFGTNRIGQTIILGNLRSTGIDKYRYYFVSDNYLNQTQQSIHVLQQLFNRVLALIDNFIVASAIKAKIGAVPNLPRQTPTIRGTDALLQNCGIPAYYDIAALGNNNTILKFWNPNGGGLRNVFCLYDPITRPDMGTKTSITNWTNYNFFMIDGHIGMTKTTALTNITNMISDQGLPIQVIDCTYAAIVKGTTQAEMKTLVVNQLKAWLVLTKGTKGDSARPTLPLMTAKFTEQLTSLSNSRDTFLNSRELLLNKTLATKSTDDLMADVFSYLGGIFSKRTIPTRQTEALDAERSAFMKYPNTVTDYQKLLASWNAYKAGVVANPPTNQLLLKDLADIEYLAGVARGGTFVLITDGTTVVGDGCLPYYYNINKARVI